MENNLLNIHNNTESKPEITMAPLVDVIFLLLIFFMVTTVFPEQGLMIEKPVAENTRHLDSNKLVIYLDQKGQAFFKEQALTLKDVRRLIKVETRLKPDIAVIIHVDKRTVTEKLITLIDAAKSSGAQQIGIATDEVSTG